MKKVRLKIHKITREGPGQRCYRSDAFIPPHARDFNLWWFCPIARRVSGKGGFPAPLPTSHADSSANSRLPSLPPGRLGNVDGEAPFPETRLAIGQNQCKLKSRA